MVKNKEIPVIAFLGSLPPPVGGFSVSLQRLIERFEENGFEYVVYDLLNKRRIAPGGVSARIKSQLWWLLRYFFSAREDLICCHYIDWRLRATIGLMTLLGKKTLLSIGGQSLYDDMSGGSWLRKKIIAFSLRQYSFVIAHNQVIEQLCLSLGVKAERIAIIPAFIPPSVKEADTVGIPQGVLDFIESHTPVISAGAFRINFHDGQDLYGIDMCVKLCAQLKNLYPKIGLVFCLPDIGDEDYFSTMKRDISDKNIEDNFLFITQRLEEVFTIWQKSDIFVRPTVVDGDAVSLREALYLKTPSLASDVVPRPEGTILFENRNVEDFVAQVKMVWDNYDYHRSRAESIEVENGLNRLLAVYNSLVSKNHG